MEDPNPDKVPRISARRANMKNNAYFSCMFFYSIGLLASKNLF